jgi:nucleotide-binding universal stress UspA family protein
MPKPIVVGVDPLREDPAPLALASVLGDLTGAPVIAVAAHPLHELPTGLVPPGYDALMRERAEAALRRALEHLPAGAESRAVASHSAARALHEVAADLDAGFLVVGSAYRGRMGRIVAGSVADGALSGAVCPVAVAPRGYERPPNLGRVCAGFADTVDGRAAVAAAASIAAKARASLEVVTAVPPVDWTGVVPPGRAYGEALALAREAAAGIAETAIDELAPGAEAVVRAVAESPVSALVEASADCDVLVCGSRGYGPLRRVLLGSVSCSLAHESHCPLVVLPRRARVAASEPPTSASRVATSSSPNGP